MNQRNHFNKKVVVLVKGNPKYWINGVSEKFYDDIRNIVKSKNLKLVEVESNITKNKLPDGDIYILFSRGCQYDYYIPKNKVVIGIGCCHKLKTKTRIYLHNPCDKTCNKDHSKQSLICHWTLTNKMKNVISKILTQFNEISETSVMAAITPYAKATKEKVERTKFPNTV